MNNWNFTGNLGKDAEQRFTPGGDSVISFSVAVKAGYGDKATTTWARCSMFGKRGEAVLQYLNKGQLVGVSGELSTREWEKDGKKNTSIEVRVGDLTLLGKSDGQRDKPAKQDKPAAAGGGNFNDFDDDIPFLFNMNTVCDTLGLPLSLWRAKHGKGLSVLRANKTDF